MLRFRARTSLSAFSRHFSATAAVAVEDGPAATAVSEATSASSSASKRSANQTLGKQLLSLVYAKRSAVITIRKWKEQGNEVRKYELNRIVRELRKLKRFKHALEICEWMTQQDDIKLLCGDYAVHLDLIAKVRGLNSAEKFFEDIPAEMRDHYTCSALLHSYAYFKEIEKAEALMKKMTESGLIKDSLPYNHMISLYISTGQLEKIPELVEELKKNTFLDAVSYNLCLTSCSMQNDVDTAEKIFLDLKKARVVPDWVTYSILTNLYIKNGFTEKAATTIKEMEKRVTRKIRPGYSSLISLYTSMGDKDGAKRIWKKMKSCFPKSNDKEYMCMISSYVKLEQIEEAEKLYTEWESVSNTRDSRIGNLLISGYVRNNQVEKAEAFFNLALQKGGKPSYTTWELLTSGNINEGKMEKALECLNKAILSVKAWKYDKVLVTKMLEKLEEDGNIDVAEQLLVLIRAAGHLSTDVYNSLLRTYAKAGKMPLIIAERMEKDGVPLNEETHELIDKTSTMCVSEDSCRYS